MTQDDSGPAGNPDGSGSTAAPKIFAHYRLQKELGRGAQGVVYLAEDTKLGRRVALKLLAGSGAQSQAIRDRFRREATITSKLDHPGICGVHELGEFEGIPFIAMQYVRGTTLAELLESARVGAAGEGLHRMSVTLRPGSELRDVVHLLERAARALHVAHEAGLVHRDIKPGNIMVTPEGDPVLLDFGLARDLDAEGQTLTASGQIMGTPAYLAAEQIRADREQVDRRTDVYAMGVTLYECLTLRRPFDASTWDQLFHSILNDAAPNPRRLNPRIPTELRTVIEKAMEREARRRYPTALELAEDLRRVRMFEPIRARPPSLPVRIRKWSQRHPAWASALALGILFVSIGGGYGWSRYRERVQAVADHLASGARLMDANRFDEALEAAAAARERDPASVAAVELKAQIEAARDAAERAARRQSDLAAAASARDESAQHRREYARVRAAIGEQALAVEQRRATTSQAFAPEPVRAAFAQAEHELESLRADAKRLVQEAVQALERAARHEAPWGVVSGETDAAFADYYLERWREATADRDRALAAWFKTAVERHDAAGRHRTELLGRGSLTVTVAPAEAEVYLFRYEPYDAERAGAIPRLVPVPTRGIGRVRDGAWCDGFHPGDPCLSVLAVEPGSPADAAGLCLGDLVVALNGQPCGDGLFVGAVGDGASAGPVVPLLCRIRSVNGVPVQMRMDWEMIGRPQGDTVDAIELEGSADPIACDRRQVSVVRAQQVLEDSAPIAYELTCLRAGAVTRINIAAGARAGLRCEVTAYPLICADANRVAPVTLEVDPGAYLLVERHADCEPERFHVFVERQGTATAQLRLRPQASTPDGFAYVPPGPFGYGGEAARAANAAPRAVVDLPGFFIARRELSSREWFEFVNDPATRARITASQQPIFLPRDTDKLLTRKDAHDRYELWFEFGAPSPDTPVLGITWNDAQGYLAWRNAKAEAANEPWLYDLPTQQEWEKAARGVDGRELPWGDRHDFALAINAHRQRRWLLDVPGGSEPRDESPFGVLDMCGSREEWTRDAVPGREPPLYVKCGAGWGASLPTALRAAARSFATADNVSPQTGLRLVARPRR